ncbi:ABC transporter substrate-binding protein [Actinoplanes sp. NBRC 103695]|uniref:ABC transporter substrate-binding protein n=1 Tax=Actinoplanes sp. NBRC 103695 TaxID=3032202 RepID=UPI0024A12220|nr:ABC transporter substrate-binding protein [Actinoplanes sp. NBRC 103695]GLY93205.1 sugar ABC transporter substrate-binding protein [Actinoplanes sp. NBRC 103695]
MKTLFRTATAVALIMALTACGSGDPTSATKDTDRLEVMSWWTSGSEAAALDTLLAAFRQAHPGVEPVNAAVAGGGGSQAVVALVKRLRSGDPPDVWQTFAGKSVQGYAGRGTVRDVASVLPDEVSAAMQPTIRQSLNQGGKPYGVPTGAHRSNVLWFNLGLLRKAGVAAPAGDYTLATFLTDLRKVKASGATALCLGGKDPFTTVELFENTLLSAIGTAGWADLVNDRLDWRGAEVRAALRSFGDMLTYAGPEAGGLSWDAAATRLATGGCAFASVNDSAYGELTAAGAREGRDFGAAAFPGTGGSFLAVVDVFVAATKAENAKNALGFLGGVSTPATQIAFSRAKGSVPVLRNVDVSSLPPYQQQSSKALWSSPVLLSVAHGEAMSPAFQEGFYDAVSTYVRTRSPDAFADDLREAVANDTIPQR